MASFHRELSEGLAKLDIELWRGNITVRPARPGETGALESGWEMDITIDDSTLRARQPLNIKRPLDLADLIGEQQVRIEVEGVVLFDKQIRHGGGDVQIVLSASVHEICCRTGRGEIHIEGIQADVEAYTGRGNVALSAGHARAAAGTASGDVMVSDWRGPVSVHTGKGNFEIRHVHGHVEARTSRGEIRIEGATAGIDARTERGNVMANRLSGPALLSTGHGDLIATDLEGARLEAFTSHGEITLGGRLAGAKVKTGRGDIICRLSAAKGSHELHTGRGDIILELHGSVATRVDASTRHGSIDSNLSLIKVGTSGPAGIFSQRLVGTTARSDPLASVRLNTKDGDIRIFRQEAETAKGASTQGWTQGILKGEWQSDKAEPGTAMSPQIPTAIGINPLGSMSAHGELTAAAGVQVEQYHSVELKILDAVSRGELSVDEAMVLLQSPGGPLGAKGPGPGGE